MARSTYRGSYIPKAVSQPQAEDKDSGGGLFGLGFGPNLNLGVGTALRELGEGALMLGKQGVSMLTPQKDGLGTAEFGSMLGKGITSSVVGTVETAVPGDFLSDITAAALGEQYRPQDFAQRAGDRGLLPALIEDVGNVALVGGAITAPVKGASMAAKMTGATSKAEKLAGIHQGLISKPLIRAAQHPYRVSAEHIRNATRQAKVARDANLGLLSTGPAGGLTQAYNKQFGGELGLEPYRHVNPLTKADPEAGRAMAQAYDELPDFDDSPETQASFQAYAEDVERQFEWVQQQGKVRFEFVDEDPYASHAELLEDIEKNGRMKVFRTKDGDHPYLSPEQNDKFRAVHDFIGHTELGNDFSRHGEEVAWALHSQMFRPEARRAMTVETRGQNSALNFSEASEARRAQGLEPEFAPQKVALLPEEFSRRDDAFVKDGPVGPLTQAAAKAEDFFQAVGTRRFSRDQTRIAESSRRTVARSRAMKLSTSLARDHLLQKAGQLGQRLDRATASRMVGEAITHEITGVRALIDEALDRGVNESVLKEAGVLRNPIPTELRTPELQAAITEAVDAWIVEGEATRATLLESRKGDQGLSDPLADPDAMTPALTPKDRARLSRARRALERAEKLNERITTQRQRVGAEIANRQDRIGRIGAELGRLEDRLASTIESFDHSRRYVPRAWQTKASLRATLQEAARRTVDEGGSTFDPHENRFLELGKDDGFMVAVMPKTVLEVPVDEFTPAHIEQVVDAYQDLFEHRDVMLGTWIDEGIVHIDLSERVDNIDDALIKGGARQQLAITDVQRGTFPSVPLRARPDIAAAFLTRNRGLKKVSAQIRDVAETNGWDIEDAYAMQDLLMRQAVRAADLGQVAHADDFFRRFDVTTAKRASSSADTLRQIVKRWNPTDPAQQDALWTEVQKVVADVDKALLWYNRSHEGIERLLRGKKDVTLLDGTRINPADLTYQLLAATSFNESPMGNLRITMKGLSHMLGPESDAMRVKVQEAVAKAAGGTLTLDELLEAVVPGEAKTAKGREASPRAVAADSTPDGDSLTGANVPGARMAAWAVLSGHTLEKWTPEWIMEQYKPAWGIKAELPKNLRLNKTLKAEGFEVPGKGPAPALADGGNVELEYIRQNFPEFFDRATQLVGDQGPDAVARQAISEFYGSALYTKIRSFWDNLAHPETSQAVTLDMWMARLFGMSGFEAPTQWVKVAEGVRQMAEKVGVKPHQIQAALWVYVNKEISIQKTGHFLARAEEAREMVRAGELILDDVDPIATWADEAGAPYQPDAPDGFQDAELPIMRDGSVAPETVTTRKESAEKRVKGLDKDRAAWLKVRDQVNALVEKGDVAGAERLLDRHIVKQSKALEGSLSGDANARDFADLLDPDNMTEASSKAFQDLILRLEDEGKTLAQAFEDDVLGEFVPAADETRAAIRMFRSGNLATLVHENGHMLRRMLPEAEMRAAERTYGVKAGKWTVDAEERFANDFMKYLARTEAPAGLEGTFARVRTALKDIFDMVMRTIHRGKVDPEVADIFDRWLNPEERAVPTDPPHGTIGIDLPDPETGTRPQIAARSPRALRAAGAGTEDFYQSGRRGARALAEAERVTKKKRLLEQTKERLEKDVAELEEVLETGMTKAEIEQRKLVGAAGRMEAKVKERIGNPSMERTPTRWQPLLQAYRDLAAHAEANPAIADILGDVKDALPTIQRIAQERGFNPSHVSQFTPAQVRRLVFGNMQLGLGRAVTEDKAGARSKRTGQLQRLGVQDQSIEALLSASIDATVEARTNAVIDYVEKGVARRLPKDAEIPAGWVPWSPTRNFLLTGEEISEATGRAVETTPVDTMVVPERVVKMLRSEVADHNHWSYTSVGKITSPWRAFVLTLNPGWYVRNFAGNLALAMAEGVKLDDWKTAWGSFRETDEMGRFADVPFVTSDTLATEAGDLAPDTAIPAAKGVAGFKEAVSEGGRVKGATNYAMTRMQRLNGVVDEFARAAVYHKGRRLNMTKEQAWKRASEALVDYQNLSPWERKAVRSVIPFYSWQKGILKVTVNQALDHPARAAILQQLGQMQEEYLEDLFGVDAQDVPSYYRQMATLGGGERNLRSWNPFADTQDILSPEGIARSLNPFAEVAIRKGLGAPEFFPESYRLGAFGTAEPDVDVAGELTGLGTGSPAGRVLGGDGAGVLQMGLHDQDIDRLRSRILDSRKRIRGIPNPETQPA